MGYCQNCGEAIKDTALFCEKCGKSLSPANSSDSKKKVKEKSKKTKYILIFGYLIVFCVIAIGFVVGRGYKVYDNGRAASAHCNYVFEQKYGWEQIEEMFDGCIDKYEGWYGLSWENTYSLYQETDLTHEQFEDFCKILGAEEDYTKWSEEQYIEYISEFSTYGPGREHDYTYITLDNEIVFIEFAPTNNVEDYDNVCPKVLISCVALLLLPVFCWLIARTVSKNKKK